MRMIFRRVCRGARWLFSSALSGTVCGPNGHIMLHNKTRLREGCRGRQDPAPVRMPTVLLGCILWTFLLSSFDAIAVAAGDTRDDIPAPYAGRQLPAGWANDPKILDAGKALYHGEAISSVNCAICHGKDGKPTPIARNAPDFSDPSYSQKSDAWLFWRISEGVPKTMMRGWKDFLTEEQRWQIIAYIRSLAKPS